MTSQQHAVLTEDAAGARCLVSRRSSASTVSDAWSLPPRKTGYNSSSCAAHRCKRDRTVNALLSVRACAAYILCTGAYGQQQFGQQPHGQQAYAQQYGQPGLPGLPHPRSFVRACVGAWVRACVRGCALVCLRACARACLLACVRVLVRACKGTCVACVACVHCVRACMSPCQAVCGAMCGAMPSHVWRHAKPCVAACQVVRTCD